MMEMYLTAPDGSKTILAEGTIVDIAGVKFRVQRILGRGRLVLKAVGNG